MVTMGLTPYETAIAAVASSKTTGLISIVGSLTLLRDVLRYHRNKRRDERLPSSAWLVFSMGIADLGNSFFTHFMGPWMMPAESGFPTAAGTDQTCAAQAYLSSIFFFSGALSNCLLSIIYWLIVCRRQSEHDLRTWRWRVLLFGFPWLFGLVWALASSYVIDPAYHHDDHYHDPHISDEYVGDGFETGRGWFCWRAFGEPGSQAFVSWGIVAAVVSVTCTVGVLMSMVCLISFVYNTETRMAGHAFAGDEVSRWRTIQATQQGALYATAWLVVYVPQIVAIISMTMNGGSTEKLPNWFVGMLNAIVYWRPKLVAMKRQEGISTVEAISRMTGISIPSEICENLTCCCGCISERSILGAFLAALWEGTPDAFKRSNKSTGNASVVDTNDMTPDDYTGTDDGITTVKGDRRGSGIPQIKGGPEAYVTRGELAPKSFDDPRAELEGAVAKYSMGSREPSMKVQIVLDLEDVPEETNGGSNGSNDALSLEGLQGLDGLQHITQRYRRRPSEISDEEYERFLRFLFGD